MKVNILFLECVYYFNNNNNVAASKEIKICIGAQWFEMHHAYKAISKNN